MTLLIGKIALDAKAANSLWFSQDGQRLWIRPLWGALLTVTDEGARPLAHEPSRAVALRSDRRDRVVLSWWRPEGGDNSETDVHGIVPYDLASGELGPELEVSSVAGLSTVPPPLLARSLRVQEGRSRPSVRSAKRTGCP